MSKLRRLDLSSTRVYQDSFPNKSSSSKMVCGTTPGPVSMTTNSQLKVLDMSNADMCSDDVWSILLCHQMTSIRELNLSGVELTGHYGNVLKSGFSSLKRFELCSTELKVSDVETIGKCLTQNSMRVQKLNLSSNTLRKCVRKLIGMCELPQCPSTCTHTCGYQFLEELNLSRTGLRHDDFVALSRAVKCGLSPKLKHLSINEEHTEANLDPVLKKLILDCIKHYKKDILQI